LSGTPSFISRRRYRMEPLSSSTDETSVSSFEENAVHRPDDHLPCMGKVERDHPHGMMVRRTDDCNFVLQIPRISQDIRCGHLRNVRLVLVCSACTCRANSLILRCRRCLHCSRYSWARLSEERYQICYHPTNHNKLTASRHISSIQRTSSSSTCDPTQ
jgi:hypothetical protein